MSARVEFTDGTALDLGQVAADVTLPSWLADRADDLVRMLAAVRDAVDAARELEIHRRLIVSNGPSAGGRGSDVATATWTRPAAAELVVEVPESHASSTPNDLDGAAAADSPDPSLLRCASCGKDDFTNKRSLGQHRRHCATATAGGPASPVPAPPAGPAVVAHPTMAVCDCGHTKRRHEDGDGICLVGHCACTGYEAAA